MNKTAVFQRHHVRIVGHGARTVVLAHGFGVDQTCWRAQEAALARTHRVVLFDHVGGGRADPSAYSPHRYRSLHSYAADVLELLACLDDVGPVDFVGHSMSAMIGLLAAITEPSRFRSLIFLSASPRYLDDEGYQGGLTVAEANALLDAISSNYQAWASGFAPIAMRNPERPELAEEFARYLCSIRPDIALAVYRLLLDSDHRPDLPKLSLPTLVIQSRDDVAVPVAVGRYLAEHIPRATLVEIDADGHLPHMSAPAAVNEAIQAFLC